MAGFSHFPNSPSPGLLPFSKQSLHHDPRIKQLRLETAVYPPVIINLKQTLDTTLLHGGYEFHETFAAIHADDATRLSKILIGSPEDDICGIMGTMNASAKDNARYTRPHKQVYHFAFGAIADRAAYPRVDVSP